MSGGKNYGPNVSGYLIPAGRNWEDVINQSGKAILDVEQNLLQDISTGLAEGALTRDENGAVQTVPPVPSGWLSNDFLGSSAGTLPLFVGSSAGNILTLQSPLKAHVNGWVFLIQHSNVQYTNTVTLPAAPNGNGAQRTDFVFLEVWRELLSPAGGGRTPPGTFGKSAAGRIWQQGNVLTDPSNDVALNYVDDILNATLAAESTKRVQIQCRLRVVSGLDIFTYPYGLDSPAIFANTIPPNATTPNGTPTSFNYANQSAYGDAGLWIAGDGNPANSIGSVDGYMYAIPLCAVFRRNTNTFDPFVNLNGAGPHSGTSGRPDGLFNDVFVSDDIADLRMAISPSGWDYAEVLDKNITYLLDNALRSEWTSTGSLGGGLGATGHTTLFENQIGVSSANGGTFPAGSTTGGGALVAQFDNTCRTFSARPVFESVVVEIPAPGGAWTDGASVTISPSSMAVFPYSAINWAAFAPANAQFVDVVGAFWAGTTTGKKRFDALNTTVAVLGVTNAGGLFEVQTTYVHGLATGGSVNITGVVGLPANGQWFVTVIDSTHFTLQGSTYSGSYVSGGTVQYSAITSITGLGVQPVNTVTLNTGHVATGLGLTNEPLYVELLVAYPSGNGLSNTPTADFSTTQTTFLVNNPTLLPNTTPIYFDQTLLTTAPNPSYSYYNPTLLTPAPNPLAALDWPHREALLTYTTQAGPSVVLSADSETPGNQHFTLPERATSITTVTKAPVAFGGGVTFSLDVSGRVVTISGDTTAPGDTLTVTYKAIRPFPQNGEQVSVFFNTRAPQTSRNQIIGTSLTVIPKYIPKQLYALTSGCASPDYGFPFPFAYVQTGGIFATVFNPAGLGELELNGESQISIADFNSTTGMLTLPTFVGYTPDPDAVVFTRTSGNIDSEGRTFFSTVPNAYIPSAFAQDLSDPQRHKNFLPFLAELPTNSALGFAGELVMVVLIRWAAADAYNGVYFSSPLVSHMSGVITTSAAVFRLRNNMLNRHV